MMKATDWIEHLGLVPHPEGGYYKETYRSKESIARAHLPDRFTGDRNHSTCIYFLLTNVHFSALHRIQQDEVWHFYDGDPLTLHVIDEQGTYTPLKLGKNIALGERPQLMIPAGCTFGADVPAPGTFTLTGATVAPGFDFDDFEMPSRQELMAQFPEHRSIIMELTHP